MSPKFIDNSSSKRQRNIGGKSLMQGLAWKQPLLGYMRIFTIWKSKGK